MRSVTWRALTVAFVMLLLGGCGDSDSAIDEETQPTVAEQSTTTTATDPWAVPDVIDAEYVRRVLQRIDDVRAEVRRDVYASRQFTETDRKKIEAIYTGHQLAVALNEWPILAATDHSDMIANPGPAIVAIQGVLAADPDCIWANVTFDESRNRPLPKTPVQAQVVLEKSSHDTQVNPTPWMIKHKTIPGELEAAAACG
jgi:hypothetical protein